MSSARLEKQVEKLEAELKKKKRKSHERSVKNVVVS